MLELAGGPGDLILAYYKNHNNSLNDSQRKSLAEIIINKELGGDFDRR